jgi:4-hydroxybenzoate polyprenyltransferase
LVIDLDKTLLKTDTLDETFLDALRGNPFVLFKIPLKLIVGRAAVKSFLAERSPLEVETWPVREDFLEFVKRHANAGRDIILATAADRRVAEAVAAHFPFIKQVVASEDGRNLKGKEKAKRLCELFPDGFIYAGDSAADLEVWKTNCHCVLVDAPASVVNRAKKLREPMELFPRKRSQITTLRRGLRLHKWAKNVLVFVPLVLAGKATDLSAWFNAITGFLALGLVASATYLINDLWDWSKRSRPLASGDLSIRAGLLLSTTGILAGLSVAAWINAPALAVLSLYTALTVGYSFYIKRIPLLDVLVLSTLFTTRLALGIALVNVVVSPWLLVFSMFVFLSLSSAKRFTEVMRTEQRGLTSLHGRGYVTSDAPLILGFGLASALGAIIIIILYLIEDAFPRDFYSSPSFLWTIPPIIFLFLGRIWLLCQRGELHDDPVAFALKDRISLGLGLLSVTAFACAALV